MKNIITAAALALGLTLTAAAPVKAMGVDFCTVLAEAAGHMATLRNKGKSPQDLYEILQQSDLDEEISLFLLEAVFVDAPTLTPKELEEVVFTICLSEAT